MSNYYTNFIMKIADLSDGVYMINKLVYYRLPFPTMVAYCMGEGDKRVYLPKSLCTQVANDKKVSFILCMYVQIQNDNNKEVPAYIQRYVDFMKTDAFLTHTHYFFGQAKIILHVAFHRVSTLVTIISNQHTSCSGCNSFIRMRARQPHFCKVSLYYMLGCFYC